MARGGFQSRINPVSCSQKISSLKLEKKRRSFNPVSIRSRVLSKWGTSFPRETECFNPVSIRSRVLSKERKVPARKGLIVSIPYQSGLVFSAVQGMAGERPREKFQSRINPVSCSQTSTEAKFARASQCFNPVSIRSRVLSRHEYTEEEIASATCFNPVSIRSRVLRAAPRTRAAAGFVEPFSRIAS